MHHQVQAHWHMIPSDAPLEATHATCNEDTHFIWRCLRNVPVVQHHVIVHPEEAHSSRVIGQDGGQGSVGEERLLAARCLP